MRVSDTSQIRWKCESILATVSSQPDTSASIMLVPTRVAAAAAAARWCQQAHHPDCVRVSQRKIGGDSTRAKSAPGDGVPHHVVFNPRFCSATHCQQRQSTKPQRPAVSHLRFLAQIVMKSSVTCGSCGASHHLRRFKRTPNEHIVNM
jgi:hypothetical protein